MTKILLIGGSQRSGNSEWMLRKVSENLERKGAKTEVLLIRGLNIEFCNGCLLCEEEGKCSISDDMDNVYEELRKADRIIIGTPVYFDSVTGRLKNFIDRLNPLLYNDELKGKKLGVIIVGQLTGDEGKASRESVVKYFEVLSEIFQFDFLGYAETSARLADDIMKNQNAEKLCQEMTEKIMGG